MQRLHEDDLVGHVLAQEPWEVLSFPAIAEVDEVQEIETIWGPRCFRRRQGEALHPDREPLDIPADPAGAAVRSSRYGPAGCPRDTCGIAPPATR